MNSLFIFWMKKIGLQINGMDTMNNIWNKYKNTIFKKIINLMLKVLSLKIKTQIKSEYKYILNKEC